MKVWEYTNNGKYRIESLSERTFEGALQVIKEAFLVDEAVTIGVEMTKSPQGQNDLILLSADTAMDGVSLIAVANDEAESVVAVALNKIQFPLKAGERGYFDKFANERCKDDASKALINFMMSVDARTDLFQLYGVDCILEIMFLATLKSHRRQGLANLLCHYSWQLAYDMNANKSLIEIFNPGPKYPNVKPSSDNAMSKCPGLCSTILTSSVSQKIGDRLGFDNVLDVSYEEFIFEGKSFASRIGPQSPCTRLCAKRVL